MRRAPAGHRGKADFHSCKAGGRMSARPTTQAISAAELRGDGDAARIRRQLDSLANAANRTPRLVATPRKTSALNHPATWKLPAKRRRRQPNAAAPRRLRAAPRPPRPRPAARTTKAKTEPADAEPEPPSALLEPLAVSVAPVVPEPVPAMPERAGASRAFALVAALALARSRPIFRSRAWLRYFPAIRSRSWCSPPRWKPASS